ncbi:MAG TPA: ribosome maturation factor RimP [Candidatus Eisenbacteria bacterium]|nr:ribosome maturation factor RimP [Candidatus Eisenbacteria bacterium]
MEVREEVRQLAQPLAEERGYELVDVEQASLGRHRVIRIYLDKPGGVTLGDCAQFSRRLSDAIDMNQMIPGRYHLEVSSPGLERPLRTLEHVRRFAGQRVSLTTHEATDGRRRWEGTLLGPEAGRAGVRTDEGDERWFEWAGVRSARLVVDPWAGLRQPKGGAGRRPRGGES